MSTRITIFLALAATLCLSFTEVAAQDLEAAQKLLADKRYEEAQSAFQELVGQDGVDQFEVRSGLATACLYAGDPESAVLHAGRAQDMKPDHLGNIETLARALKVCGDLKREGGSDPTGLYEQALAEFDRLVAAKTKSAEVFNERATTLYWLGRLEEAAGSYEKAAELDRQNAFYPYWAAYCYHSAQKTAEASACYVAALATGGLDEQTAGTAAQGLYNCFAGSQDWKGLNEKIAGWLEKRPTDALALWWRGYSLGLEGKFKEALDIWKRLEKASDRMKGEAIVYQGVCQQQLGDDKAAIESFTRAAKAQQNWAEDKDPILKIHGMAGALFASGQFEEACRIAEKEALPLAVGKRRVNLLSDLGLFYRDWGSNIEARGKRDEAKKCYVKARDLYETAVKEMGRIGDIDNKQRAQIQNDYALMFQYHFDDNETAVKNYKIALGYDKTNTDACLNYGRVLLRLGKLEDALAIAKQGVSRGDLDALIAQIERQMQGK